jgi:hypothetical protein
MTKTAFIVLACLFVFSLPGCGRSEEQIKADSIRHMEYRAAEAKAKNWQEEGVRALDQADKAIRDDSAERRTRLEKASKQIRTSNSNGVRVDQYILKRGGVIACTTTISGNSPAMFNCDGDV